LKFGKFADISYLGSADIIGTAFSSVFWIILASQISPDDYGEIFYFIGIAKMATAFVLIGTQNTITVYSSKKFQLESTLYFISLVASVVASFVLMILFYRVDVIFLLFGFIINSLAMGELLGNKKFKLYSIHTFIQKILLIGVGLLFLYIFGEDAIIFVLAGSYLFFSVVIINRFRKTKINFSLLKNHSKFILNNYIIEILAKSNSNIRLFIIVPLLGFTVLGNFSLAMQIVSIGLVFSVIIFKYTIPFDSRGQENKKLKKISILISIIMVLLGVFVAPLIIPIFFQEYIEVIDLIRIISFSIIPMSITKIYTSKLLGQEQSKQLVLSKIISMSSFIILIIILAPGYGIVGVGISYLVSTILETICLIPKNQIIKN